MTSPPPDLQPVARRPKGRLEWVMPMDERDQEAKAPAVPAPPWKGSPHAERVNSLLMRGRDDEAKVLIRTANAEAGHRCRL